MNPIAERLAFFHRKVETAHKASLRNLGKRRTDEYEKVVASVFAHQPAAYDSAEEQHRSDPLLPNKKEIARHFYRECYDLPTVFRGIAGSQVEIGDFVREAILEHNDEPDRNQVGYLLGEVGVGKTALINYLITTQGKEWLESGVWFVRVDLDPKFGRTLASRFELLDLVAQKTVRTIERTPAISNGDDQIAEATEALRLTYATPVEDIQDGEDLARRYSNQHRSLKHLAQVVTAKSHRRLFLVIDNLDYLCHIRDRGLCNLDGDTQEMEALLGLCDLAAHFLHSQDLDDLGANILFVMRSDSYEILKDAAAMSLPQLATHMENTSAYQVESPGWNRVLTSRISLLSFVVAELQPPGKQKEYDDLVRLIREHIESVPFGEKKLIEHLENITNFGLREMMHFFSQYAWLPGPQGMSGETGVRRFIKHHPVGLLTFLLGRKRMFSERRSGFPNIYLSPGLDELAIPGGRTGCPSYWLKRLISHFVEAQQRVGARVTPLSVVEVFCGSDSTSAYAEPVVRACLGSLTDASCSRMLHIERQRNRSESCLEIADISLTPRGSYCLAHIVDTFVYLQLVIDDPALPIPGLLADDFVLGKDAPDYGYLVATGKDYRKGLMTMITRKARRVLLFLEVLEASWSLEAEAKAGVFRALRSNGVAVPTVDRIRCTVELELKRLQRVDVGLVELEDLQNTVAARKETVRNAVGEAYRAAAPETPK